MGKPTREQVKRYNAKHKDKQREAHIGYAKKQQRITEEARELRRYLLDTVGACACGETKHLQFTGGTLKCEKCMLPDIPPPSIEQVAERRSIIGSSAAEFGNATVGGGLW